MPSDLPFAASNRHHDWFDKTPSSTSSSRVRVRSLLLLATVLSLLSWLKYSSQKDVRLLANEEEAAAALDLPLPSSNIRRLKGVERSGAAARVQRACGETEPDMSAWLDTMHLHDPNAVNVIARRDMIKHQSCAASLGGTTEAERAKNLDRLVRSAARQCGSWCVWDVDTDERVGWHINALGDCFKPFRSPHSCDEFWWQKDNKHMQ